MAKKGTEDKLIQPDGVAASPLPDYPGQLRMPLVMTLPMHKRWQTAVNQASDRDPDAPRVGIAFKVDETGNDERFPFLYDDVALGLAFGDLEVKDPRGRTWTSKDTVDTLPLPVAVWVARVYREWEDSQLSFRWNGRAGVAAQAGA